MELCASQLMLLLLLLLQVPVDSWLQLLQAACHAVRSVTRLHGYYSLKAIYRWGGCVCVGVCGVGEELFE